MIDVFTEDSILHVLQESEYAFGLLKLHCRGSKRGTWEGSYIPN